MTGLNVKLQKKIEKLNIGVNIDDLGLGKEFLDLTPEAKSIKGKIEGLDFIKIKTFAL